MLSAISYALTILVLGSITWALHWGPLSQILVLVMGLSVFPVQKFVHRSPIKDLGFRTCTPSQLLKGGLLPVGMLGLVALTGLITGEAHARSLTSLNNPFTGSPASSLWDLAWFLMLSGAILFVLEFVTEELMFRGYILGKFTALGEFKGLALASAVFGAWHLPIAIWGIGPDPIRTPLYILNMVLLGTVLGSLFLESRSLIPVAAFHAIWNTLEYNLFGFMDQQGLLVGSSRTVFDAEEGYVGTVVLLAVAVILLVRRYGAAGAIKRRGITVPSQGSREYPSPINQDSEAIIHNETAE